MSNTKFQIKFNIEFDTSDIDSDDIKELQQLTIKQLKKTINDGFNEHSFDLFGEDLACLGLLTPQVESIKKLT